MEGEAEGSDAKFETRQINEVEGDADVDQKISDKSQNKGRDQGAEAGDLGEGRRKVEGGDFSGEWSGMEWRSRGRDEVRGAFRGFSMRRGEGRPGSRPQLQGRSSYEVDHQSIVKASNYTAPESTLDFEKLEELSTKEPSEVAVSISSSPAFKALLGESVMQRDTLELLCLVLSKAFRSQADGGSLQHLAGLVKDSSFLRTLLPHYLASIGLDAEAAHREQYPQHLDNILAILTQVLNIFPASSMKPMSLLLVLFPPSMDILRTLGVNIPAQIEEHLGNLQHQVTQLQIRSREGTLHSDEDPSTDDVQLNKAEQPWKPSVDVDVMRMGRRGEEVQNDPEQQKTQRTFRHIQSILNKLMPQNFQRLMKQVTELTIDTEERLKGVIDLTFEKAISEPDYSVAYANMCRCLMGLKVPATDKPGTTLNFRKLLLNRCQKEFEKDKDDMIFEKKQKELEAASSDKERQRLTEELEDAKDKARRRSLGNIKFLGELFKLKMLTEVIMHDCIVKLLKNYDEESLECLCLLLSTIGKDLDFEKAKPRLDQYFNQMEKIIKERKTRSKIRFKLQDVLDLRRSNWIPRQMKTQQVVESGGSRGRMRGPGGRGTPHTPGRGRGFLPLDEGWNTVLISKNKPIYTSQLSKITPPLGFNSQLLAPGGKGMWGRWGKGSSGSTSTKPVGMWRKESGRGTSTESADTSSETECSREREQHCTIDPVPQMKKASTKPALTEEELNRKSAAIIEEYIHIYDMKETLLSVQKLNSPQLLFVFVRNGVESTLERSTIAREHMGLLLHQLIKTGILSKPQYFKGLQEILEVAEDLAVDMPCIWRYLAELITPMLLEGGIPMAELFREVTKPQIPLEKHGVLLVQILRLLSKRTSHEKAGLMWREAGLKWKDFLPEDEDVNKFVREKNVEFTLEESEESKKSEMILLDLTNHLDRLIQDQTDNQTIFDWIEDNLDEKQTSSNKFIRALMTCICQSAIICKNPYKVNADVINHRSKLLLKFLKDEQKELQALYALQALMVQMDQPPNLLRMFFDALYDADVIKEEALFKWEFSKDPAEQTGKAVALKSITAFFTWLREAEDESDSS